MKELSIEEKAQRYDEAIEKAKQFHNRDLFAECNGNLVEYIFPELRESDDVQHRKWILEYLYDGLRKSDEQFKCQFKCAINWLEKQVPVHLSHDDEIMIRQLTEYFTTGKGLQNTNDTVVEWLADVKRKLEKQGEQKSIDDLTQQEAMDIAVAKCFEQGEQKPADKLKFKVGDFIVNDYCAGKVIELTNDAYLLDTGQGVPFSCEHNAHFWAIQDAKDGDVLEFGDHGRLVVGIVSYVNKTTGRVDVNCLLENNNFKVGNYYNLDTIKPHPAAKEQRDTLMKAMADAGYEWDAEKKELRKIEKKPAWSEEDEKIYQSIIDDTVQENQLGTKQIDWIRNIKYRNFSRPLKQWKPSDEQMSALSKAIAFVFDSNSDVKHSLESLYNELKKL